MTETQRINRDKRVLLRGLPVFKPERKAPEIQKKPSHIDDWEGAKIATIDRIKMLADYNNENPIFTAMKIEAVKNQPKENGNAITLSHAINGVTHFFGVIIRF